MSRLHAIMGAASGRRSKWVVLVFWLVILGVFGSLSGKLTGAEQNNEQAWLPGSAQSTKVLALESRLQSPNIFTAVVVYDRSADGHLLPLTSADRAKAAADARLFADVPGVLKNQIAGPITAANGKAIETIVPVNLGSKGYDGASAAATSLRAISRADAGGLASHIAGPLGNAADSASAFSGISGTLLGVTLGVVIVLLLVTYRSPMLWLLPVISAAAALGTSEGAVYLLARAGLTVNAQSAGILDVLVFGAATDYALLLTARYREELRRHEDRHEAMAVALRRAGPAIIASAATVIASLLTLTVAELNSTKDMGPVLAIGVAIAMLAMMTLLPALLVICGRWVFWPARPVYGSEEPTSRGLWARTGGLIARRPRRVWITTVVVLGAMALGLLGLKASGLTTAESFRGHPDSVAGQTVIDQTFAAGGAEPVQVVANAAQAAPVAAAFRAVPDITQVTAPVVKDGHAYLNGTLTVPPDSPAAYTTVNRVRAAVQAVPGADALVGGTSATTLDVQRANSHDREVIIPVILAVVLVILMLILRALIAPVVLVATVVLSFAAALGVSSLFFNNVFNFGGADASFPLFLFVFLVSLGTDYNIFLMTRVREETARHGARQGALTGLAATGGVITSAGAVLAGTFAALTTLPLTMLVELGFGVAFGVLLDTIVVRSVLVTALNLDLGRWTWWPSKLARYPALEPVQLDGRPSPVP